MELVSRTNMITSNHMYVILMPHIILLEKTMIHEITKEHPSIYYLPLKPGTPYCYVALWVVYCHSTSIQPYLRVLKVLEGYGNIVVNGVSFMPFFPILLLLNRHSFSLMLKLVHMGAKNGGGDPILEWAMVLLLGARPGRWVITDNTWTQLLAWGKSSGGLKTCYES